LSITLTLLFPITSPAITIAEEETCTGVHEGNPKTV
jgi:hypothetical protein